MNRRKVNQMSKFTTEVRYICENYARDSSLNIEQTIEKAKPYIFNDTWSASTEEHKEELEQKILRHYYMQEIGFETVGLWKLYLNSTLAEIMPKYNVLYNNLDNIKNKLFETADFTDESTGNSEGNNEGKSISDGNSTSSNNTDINETSKANQESTSSSNSSNNSTSEAWQKYNDTPQGSIKNLDNDTYLTNATKNISTSDATGTSNSTSKGDSGASREQTTNTKDQSESHNIQNTTGHSTSTNKNIRTVKGKNSGGDYLSQYVKLMQDYNDIDQMIIQDLQPLFMGLWE